MEQQEEHKFPIKTGVLPFDGLLKTLKILIIAALIFIISAIFFGCNKDNNKSNNDINATYNIVAADLSSLGKYHFSYNSDGKLIRATADTTDIAYEYTGNTIIVTTLLSEKFHSRTIITFNSAGLATNARTENNADGTDWFNDAFEYNGEELSKMTNTSSSSSSPRVTTYTWLNQNMVSVTLSSAAGLSTTTFDYYVDKPRQKGDYLSFLQLFQGYEIFKNKNLLKSISDTRFVYEFEPDGNISSVAFTTGGDTRIFNYRYQCN